MASKASFLIATKPHGLNSIDLSRWTHQYFELEAFDERLIEEYIRKFFANKNPSQLDKDNFSELVLEIKGWIENLGSNFSPIFGTPLQISQLCEILLGKLAADSESNLREWFYKNKPLELATLYKEVVFSGFYKLDPRSLEETKICYDYWDKILNFLSIEAFGQIFSKDDEWREKYHKLETLSQAARESLHWTGLIEQIHPENRKRSECKFTHKTYREYFGALYLLRAFFRRDTELQAEILKDINHNKYMEHYKIIFIFAFQISLNGHPLLPQSEEDRKWLITKLWKTLYEGEPRDIIGKASKKLFFACIDSLTEEQRKNLHSSLPEEYQFYGKKLITMGRNQNINAWSWHLLLSPNKGTGSFPKLRLESLRGDSLREEKMISSLIDQDEVRRFTQGFIEKRQENRELLAKCFKKVILREDLDHFWGIRGGFEAMALLGDDFDEDHASYFQKVINEIPQLSIQFASSALEILIENSSKQEPLEEVISLILLIFQKFERFSLSYLLGILQKNPLRLLRCLSHIVIFKRRSSQKLSDLTKLIFAIAFIAEYAIVLSENKELWLITGQERLSLSVGPLESNFKEIVSELIEGYQPLVHSWFDFLEKKLGDKKEA